jgi:hypothetical protein
MSLILLVRGDASKHPAIRLGIVFTPDIVDGQLVRRSAASWVV